jgi:hypothetical protein
VTVLEPAELNVTDGRVMATGEVERVPDDVRGALSPAPVPKSKVHHTAPVFITVPVTEAVKPVNAAPAIGLVPASDRASTSA